MRLLARLLFIAPSVIVVAGCADGIDVSAFAQSGPRGTFERTLAVSGPVDLRVRSGSGDIRIRVGSGDRVLVTGYVTAGRPHFGEDAVERVRQIEARPPVEQTGNVISIGNVNDDPLYRNVSITYELSVPADTQINARTGSGDQTIGGVNGAVQVRTGSGDIEIERAGGGLDAETGSGDIRAGAVSGAIHVQTGSGDIDVAQIASADVEAQTGSGDVALRLPPDAAFALAARTGSGSISTNLPMEIQGERNKRRLSAVVRGGGHRVSISTGSGSIRVD